MTTNALLLQLPSWIDEEIDPARIYADADARIELAIQLATRNIEHNTGGPFGAAIFDGDGRVVAAGVNLVLPQNCSSAHAEIVAFSIAQMRLGRARLNDDGRRYQLATSAQPCSMCFGASFWAGIDEILIGARAEDVMELTEFDEGPLPDDWIGELEKRGIAVQRDLRRADARAVLEKYTRDGGKQY